MITNQPARPKTLGLLGTGLVTVMQNQLWQGAMTAAQKYGAGLVYYPTISLSSDPPFAPQTKVLFDLVDSDSLDGLLIWHAGISEGIATGDGVRVFERYEGIPLVTIGGQYKNYPDLSVDNYQGVRAAVEHLVKVHGRRHIAVIRGPVGHFDADERYRGYIAELEAQGLPIDPEYIAYSAFELLAAAEMSETAVDGWLRKPDRKLDAIVTASDYMAIATIKAIEARGLRVPEDISVIGFDDVADSQATIPSITTVRQPFYDMGYRATEMLMALVNGQSSPAQSTMPAQVVVRESCGCLAKSLSLAETTHEHTSEANQGNALLSDLATLAADLAIPADHLETLVGLLQKKVTSDASEQFLLALRRDLMESMKSRFDAMRWQDVVSLLRKYRLSRGELGAIEQSLFDQARVLVTELSQRSYIREKIQADLQIENLRRTSEGLITSFGTQLLVDTLQEHLGKLGFPSFYLSLYENSEQPSTWSNIILAYHDNQRLNLDPVGQRIPTRRLVPESVWLAARSASLVVEPLYFREQQLGILVLEVGPTDGSVYETLRTQISSALQGSQLVREIQQRAAEMEQRVAERTSELTQTVELLRKAEEANRLFSERLKALFEVTVELSAIDQMDELSRRAIELGQSRLKFDRLSLWFTDRDPDYQVGSFGIDENGNIRDERNQRINIDPITDHLGEINGHGRPVYYRDSGALYNEQREIIGLGWLGVGTLLDGNRTIGILSVDNLLSLKPIEPYQLELLALYSTTLGNLVTRLRAGATLRDSEERYRALYHDNPSMLYTVDDQGIVVSVNEFGASQLGYTIDAIIGLPARDLFFEADQEAVVENFQLCLQNPLQVYQWQFRKVRKDGSILWVEEYTRALKSADGSLQVLIVCQDITERKRAEGALQESEERLRQVVRTGNLGIFDHNHITEDIYWSPELRGFYGLDPDEPISMPLYFSMLYPDDRERITAAVQRAYDPAGDGSFDVEHRITERNGSIRWLLTRSRTFFEGDGNARHAVRTIGAAMDITQHKYAEEALRQSEEHARAFQEKLKALQEISFELATIESPEQMCLRSIELGCERLGYDRIGFLVYESADKSRVSRYGIESTGELHVEHGIFYTAEEARHDTELMNRDPVHLSDEANLRNFNTEVSIGRGWNIMGGIRDANASIGWLAADNYFERKPLLPYQVELLNLYGLTLGHLLTRKRAEAEIRKLNDELEQRVIARTKELEDANEEIRHFVYIVSHDLRAPLVNLKGFSGELRSALKVVKEGCDEAIGFVNPTKREGILHALEEDIPEALKFIESAVDNMDSFTKAILKLSRLGRLQLDLVSVDLKSIVEKTLETFSYQIKQRGIMVTVGDLPIIAADYVSMEQIFGNILSNAVVYLLPGRSGEIKISAESTDDKTIIRVQDNGRGILKEDMEKVFAPFRRAGKQDVPGEGMGLAYVQTLVRRHGGRIWFDSEIGVGTTFTFIIPNDLIQGGDEL